MGTNTEALNFKVAAELKEAIQAYADAHHMTFAAAARILLQAGLDAQTPRQRRPERRTYAENRPYTVAESLDDLTGPTRGIVDLPQHLDWSGSPTYDLDNPKRLNTFYRTVLAEASSSADLSRWLDRETLIRIWPDLYLAPRLRQLWETRFPQLNQPSEDP